MSTDPQPDPLPPPPPAAAAPPAAGGGANCPFCLTAIVAGDATTTCPSCHAVHHHDCWEENQGCAVYGCTHVPVVESRRALEVPVSYWGQENKPCPSCGQQILATALRCRHCGTTFATARPQESAEFQRRGALLTRLPAARRTVVTLFVLSVIPIASPVAAVWGLFWRTKNEDVLDALPPLHAALSKIAVITACAVTIAFAVLTMLFVLVGRH